ncbi:hypothetical protein MF672_038815 [Actinomadura sp. ATCC 31491]|uniref:Uncharacterized protein n=1 Tax=Actinomadura luzonensis TaxID=2805427 RepID=A0ABT0G6J1_9ACTN|nr:hypothetical protein [Actinomadura luzonensis]MCK2219706.1 hypothetical protein [Actinomadura luzonensis]
MPASSREELRVPWGPGLDGFPVGIAVVLETADEPAEDDYHAASWDGEDAVLLIGQGSDVELVAGEYVVWTRLEAASQRPVRRSGTLTVGTP